MFTVNEHPFFIKTFTGINDGDCAAWQLIHQV